MKYDNYIKIEFPSKSCNENLARSVVGVFAAQLDPTMDEMGDVKTAVSEAVTNCVVHAYPESIGRILLRCRILEGEEGERVEASFEGVRVLFIAWWIFTAVFWSSAVLLMLWSGAPAEGLFFLLLGAGVGAAAPLLSLRSAKSSLRFHLQNRDEA